MNVSSLAGRLGFALRTPYASAKWGVVGLTKSLAIELLGLCVLGALRQCATRERTDECEHQNQRESDAHQSVPG